MIAKNRGEIKKKTFGAERSLVEVEFPLYSWSTSCRGRTQSGGETAGGTSRGLIEKQAQIKKQLHRRSESKIFSCQDNIIVEYLVNLYFQISICPYFRANFRFFLVTS